MTAVLTSPRVRIAVGPLAGKTYELQSGLRIGRHPFNEMSLSDPGVSRYHCWITMRDGQAHLEDLASANGTFVNGERLASQRVLAVGDKVRVGSTEFEFTE